MPFVENEVFEKYDKQAETREKLDKKIENATLNKKTKQMTETKEGNNKFDAKTIVKEVMKMHKPQKEQPEPKITINDIKQQIQISKMIKQEKDKEVDKILESKEIGEVKKTTIDLLAVPHFDPIKRKIFANKLHNSEIVNTYIDNNFIFRAFNSANENVKFGVVYAMNFFQTNEDYKMLVALKQQQLQQQQQQTTKQEAPKQQEETPKEETKPEEEKKNEEEEKQESTSESSESSESEK